MTADEVTALLGSLRTTRDLAMAGLMLYRGLRSCEVLALESPMSISVAGGCLSRAKAARNAGYRWTAIWPRSSPAIC